RVETPPSPLSTILFIRDPDFIYNKSSVAGSRIALIGLGGIRSMRVMQPDSSKVSGTSRTRLKSRLRDEKIGNWVYFLDNIDNDQLLYSVPVVARRELRESIAASYIRNRTPRSSISQYLKDFLGSDCEATKLLEKEAELPSDSSSGETSESVLGPDFKDNVVTLRDYSFISIIENSTLFTIYRLINGRVNSLVSYTTSSLLVNTKIGRGVGHSFPISNPYCRNGQNRPNIYEHRPYYFIEVYDAREIVLTLRNERTTLLGEEHEEVLNSISILGLGPIGRGRAAVDTGDEDDGDVYPLGPVGESRVAPSAAVESSEDSRQSSLYAEAYRQPGGDVYTLGPVGGGRYRQPGVDIPELGPIGGGRAALGTGDRDEQSEAWRRLSRHPDIYI
ncbi:Tetratricopeptide-like helical, partial [Penicillium majusculum]